MELRAEGAEVGDAVRFEEGGLVDDLKRTEDPELHVTFVSPSQPADAPN
jgi:hypothetical protein